MVSCESVGKMQKPYLYYTNIIQKKEISGEISEKY